MRWNTGSFASDYVRALMVVGVLAGCSGGGQDDTPLDTAGSLESAITGGNLVSTPSAPYGSTVSIGGCTALKIAANWYLTAWHCGFTAGANVAVSNAQDPSTNQFNTVISEVVKHPTTLVLANNHGFDLAMLRLQDTNPIVTWTPRYAVQADPSSGRGIGYGCDLIGPNWGKKTWADFNTIAYPDAVSNVNAFSSVGDPSLCQGDSGGPFFNIINTKYYLTGNASLQSQNSNPRGSAWTRVSPARDWVEAVRASLPGKNDFSEGNQGTFLNMGSNWCSEGAFAANNLMMQRACYMADDLNQRFDVHALGNSVYEFRHSSSPGNCLAIKAASTSNGAAVTTLPCDGSPNTQWGVSTIASNDTRLIVNMNSGRCMRAGSPNKDTHITQATCALSPDFSWVFTD